LCLSVGQVNAQTQASSINELLDLVEQARLSQTEAQRQREEQFRSNVNQRQQMLDQIEQQRAEEEAISAQLDATWNENELIKAQRFETLQERLGDLDELFGTISGVVGDTRATFEGSLISAQYP